MSGYETNEDGDQVYTFDSDGTAIYARNENGQPYYARNRFQDEYYPRVEMVDQIWSQIGRQKTIVMYARDRYGKFFYPKGRDQSEYVPPNAEYLRDENNDVIYPLNANGRPKYPQKLKSEYYVDDKYIGKDKDGNLVYARDKDQNEYYPSKGRRYILDKNGRIVYAKDKNGDIVFPVDENGNEYYFKSSEGFDLYSDDDRYAKHASNSEMYPITRGGMEVILRNTYARDKDNNPFYPKDENGNEYTLDPVVYLDRYPMTHDGFIIVAVDSKPVFLQNNNTITSDHFIGKLYRTSTEYKDYLTNVKESLKEEIPFERRPQPRDYYYRRQSDGLLIRRDHQMIDDIPVTTVVVPVPATTVVVPIPATMNPTTTLFSIPVKATGVKMTTTQSASNPIPSIIPIVVNRRTGEWNRNVIIAIMLLVGFFIGALGYYIFRHY
jgi:hypothetical protein